MKRNKGHAGLGLEIIAKERQMLAGKWEKGKGWEDTKEQIMQPAFYF